MRKRYPQVGDARTVTKFLWFPKTLRVKGRPGGRYLWEKRWLEYATWKQIYYRVDGYYAGYYWKDVYWCDEDGE